MGIRVTGSTVKATTRNKSLMEGSHWHCRRAPWALEQLLVVVWGSHPVGLKRLPLAGVVAWVACRKHARASYTRCFRRLPGC